MSKQGRDAGDRTHAEGDFDEDGPWPGKRSATQRGGQTPEWPGKRSMTSRLGSSVPRSVEATVANKRAGTPVDAALARRVGGLFSTDLSATRVHDDPEAHQAAEAIGARAFAYGSDIFLGDGESMADTQLIAHELAHVAQQQQAGAATPQAKLTIGDTSHPAEAQADRVAALATSNQPSSNGYRPLFSAGSDDGVIRRAPKSDYEKFLDQPVGPNQYVRTNAKDLYLTIKSRFTSLPMELPSDFLSFVDGNAASYMQAFLEASMTAANRDYDVWPEIIREAVKPEDLRELIDGGRVLTDKGHDQGKTEEYATGPLRWYPSVASPVIEALLKRMQESLRRIGPRYLTARCGPGITPPATGASWHQPATSSIVASHPCDPFTIAALCADGVVAVDGAGYRSEHEITAKTPAPATPAKDLGTAKPGIDWRFVDDPKAPNVVVVTKPHDATAEQVATTLLGAPTAAYKIIAAPPYFALEMPDAIALRRRANLPVPSPQQMMSTNILEISRDPSLALLRSGTSEEAALGQAGADQLTADTTDRGSVLRSLERTLYGLKACQGFVRRFGTSQLLVPTIDYIQGKLKSFATAPEPEVLKWATQVEKQSDIVMRAAIGLDTIERHLTTMKLDDPNALAKASPVIRGPIERVARELVDAAVLSRMVATAEDRVSIAERDLELAPIETLDAILADVRVRLHAFSYVPEKYDPNEGSIEDPWENKPAGKPVKYSRYQAASTEIDLRKELTAIRALVLAHDPSAGERIKAVYTKVDNLSLQTEIGSTAGALGDVLDRFMVKIKSAWTIIVHEMPDAVDAEILASKYKSTLETAWGYFVGDQPDMARKTIQDLTSSDKHFSTFLQVAYDKIDEIEGRIAIAKIAAMVGIALVSMGVGSVAEGVAVALNAGEIGAFLVSSFAESVAFTALDNQLLGNPDVAGSLISNFLGNLATFGLLKAWRMRKAAKIADDAFKTARLASATRLEKMTGYLLKGKELTKEGLLIAATAFAQAEIDAARKTGKFLSLSEIRDAGKQGVAMMLGIAIGGRLLRTHLDDLRKAGFKITTQLENKFDALREMAKTVEKTKNAEQALELVREDRALMEHELASHGYTADPPGKGMHEAPKEVGAEIKQLDADEMALGLDEVVPGRSFMGTPEQIEPVLAKLKERGAKVQKVDEAGSGRRYEVSDGKNHYTINEAKHYAMTRSGGAIAKQPLTQIEPNSVVGHVKDVTTGRDIMRRLVAGDRTALHDLGYESFPPGMKTNEVEWGLGRRWDGKIAVVLGSFHEINWANLPHITPLSHTHPLTMRTRLVGTDGNGEVSINQLGDLNNDMAKLFPSAADISLMARANIKDHTVHTPFVTRGNDRVGNPTAGEKTPTVDFVIEKAKYVGRWEGQEDIGVYKATITARAGGKPIWTGEVWAIDAGASFLYKNKPKIAETKLPPPGGEMRLGAGGSDQIHDPLPGLYDENIRTDVDPKDWTFHDEQRAPSKGVIEIKTTVGYRGKTGRVTRSYNKKTGAMTMSDIDLTGLPNKVMHEGAMTSTGTPTSAFVSMRQMKMMGIEFGSLKKVKMANVRNVDSVFQMHQLHEKGASYEEAVRQTKSVEYATTTLEQSGHQVVTEKISLNFEGGKHEETAATVMDSWELPSATQKELLAKYNLKPDTKVVVGFDISIPVVPHPSNTPPTTVPTP